MTSKNGTPLGMKCFYCFVFCLFSTGLFGQREAANWYFGKNAGLDFNSGTPVPLLDGQLDTAEGCATFSDADGNLLFYTDGITVWDRFHGIMPNGEGLFGNTSSSQAALVVPHPGSDFIYYIFTPDAIQNFNNGSSRGLNYSVVDMTRNSGRGDVIQKNVNLLPNCSEKISGVLSVSDDSIWVVTHYIDTFYAFKVDATGVVHNPVSSRIAPTIGDFNNIRGAIKFAPNGRRIAITHAIFEPEFNGLLYVYDFDQVTGKVDNATLLGDDMVYYGVEFSSNSSKLYASAKSIVDLGGIRNTRSIQILQYDLDAANIGSSQFVVGEFPSSVEIGNLAGTLQIGIDKKIYHTLPNNKLSVINAPNFGGLSADFRIFDVGLGERIPRFGLPPFIQSFFETVVEITNFCEGEPTRFTLDDPDVVQSIVWNFGDPVSGNANVSTEKNPSHVFSATGNFTVTIQITYTNGQQREFIEFVEISEPPNIIGHVALEQCDADGMDDGIASFNLSEARSLFANGNEDIMGSYFLTLDDAVNNENQLDPFDYTNTVNDQLIYARAFANSDCFQIVEITLRVKPLTDLGEYTTIQVCDQQNSILENTVQLKETRTFLTTSFPGSDIGIYDTNENAILEQNELIAEEFVFTSNERALYFRVETNNSCNFIGKLGLDFIPRPEFEGHPDAIFCSSGTTLAAATGFE
ncbi:MAG: PKD domain-containing protein, partial [Bacteroidota bacterium]